jgi:hypothetical protein
MNGSWQNLRNIFENSFAFLNGIFCRIKIKLSVKSWSMSRREKINFIDRKVRFDLTVLQRTPGIYYFKINIL